LGAATIEVVSGKEKLSTCSMVNGSPVEFAADGFVAGAIVPDFGGTFFTAGTDD
jgi:hypothetical protein